MSELLARSFNALAGFAFGTLAVRALTNTLAEDDLFFIGIMFAVLALPFVWKALGPRSPKKIEKLER
ncbi:MAG: hypothetical protein J0H79_14190 [Alphaproteobacteria bacterium]|nr:hypothetical protein [Alphaproteobacteria bacterium]OJU57337.1 MAG: hypothetical protein BGO00_04570 [Alphaproteobacteria bacterium 62-8]